MDYGDAFLRIFNKHQTKMEHWNVRSTMSVQNSTNGEEKNFAPSHYQRIIEDHAKSNSPRVFRSHVKNTHSSKFIEERFKMMLDRDSFRNMTDDNNTQILENNSFSREGLSAERKNMQNDESVPGRFGTVTVTSTKEGVPVFKKNKLVKLFDEKKSSSFRLKSSSPELKKKSMFATKEDYILDDIDTPPKSSSIERLKRRFVSPKSEISTTIPVMSSPKFFLPHESDVQKMRIKTNASPARRINYRKTDSLTQNSNLEDDRLDITGLRLSKEPSAENQQQILGDLKQQENTSQGFNFQRFLSNVITTKTANDFWSPKSELTQTNGGEKRERKYFTPKQPSTNSNGLIKRNLSTLQTSKFPVFDSIPNLPNLTKLETFESSTYEDLESAGLRSSAEFYPRPKDKSSTMISSKHNLFRMKPKKAFLEISHYGNQKEKNIHIRSKP